MILLLSVLRIVILGAGAVAFALMLWVLANARLRWRASLLGNGPRHRGNRPGSGGPAAPAPVSPGPASGRAPRPAWRSAPRRLPAETRH